MANYLFSTITPAQALALVPGVDDLSFNLGTANTTTILYVPAAGGNPDLITMIAGGRSVNFAATVAPVGPTFVDGSQIFIGGAGNDSITFGATNDAIFGGAGNDILNAGAGNNVLQGNQGDDLLIGTTGSDTIYGGADNDRIVLGGSGLVNSTVTNFGQGNKGNDTITGGAVDADTILGGQGNDLIGAATFSLTGAPGSYVVTLTGFLGGGNDFLNGNLGDDTILGGAGNDQIFGEDGNDLIIDGGGTTFPNVGGGGRDTIDAGAGNDTVVASGGSDTILFGDGDDLGGILGAGTANDLGILDGGAGNDQINGGAGRDQMIGGAGNDTIDGFGGADTATGGAGADVFEFYGNEAFTVFANLDRITDWTGSEDRLFFANGADIAVGSPGPANYVETTAADYATALTLANTQIGAGGVDYVSVQVGADVYVFVDALSNNGQADSAILLVGRMLADIANTNFVVI